MPKIKKVSYMPEMVAKEMEKNAKNYSSESAYIAEAVRQLNAKEKRERK